MSVLPFLLFPSVLSAQEEEDQDRVKVSFHVVVVLAFIHKKQQSLTYCLFVFVLTDHSSFYGLSSCGLSFTNKNNLLTTARFATPWRLLYLTITST